MREASRGPARSKDVIRPGRGRGYGRTYVRFSDEVGEGAVVGKEAGRGVG